METQVKITLRGKDADGFTAAIMSEQLASVTAERDRYKAALEKIAAGAMFPAAIAHAVLKDLQ